MAHARARCRLAISTVIAISAFLPVALSAQAANPGPYTPASASGVCTGVPGVAIYTSKLTRRARFFPTSVKVKVSTTASLCIKNLTSATQTVTYLGSPLATIQTMKVGVILCNVPNTATFGLASNPRASLALTCTQ